MIQQKNEFSPDYASVEVNPVVMNMSFRFKLSICIFLLILAIAPAYLWAREQTSATSGLAPVNLEQFPTIETRHMMKVSVDGLDCLGKWSHMRDFWPIDKQNVVHMNRDTLYSSRMLDLSEPATIIKPVTQGRYQSILAVNEAHFAKLKVYESGEYELTQKKMGSRYMAVITRTLVDAEDAVDLAQAQKAEDKPSTAKKETAAKNFLQRGWYTDQGVELPRPFGIGVNAIFMERDITVTDVSLKIGNLPPKSISDRFDFEVSNRTILSMMRLDAWVLPFLDVYAMFGETRTDTSLSTTFELSPSLGSPVPVTIETDQKVDGPLYGGGATAVLGGDIWFAMADANYSRSDLDTFEGTLDAWFLSSRLGWHRTINRCQVQLWGGIGYIDAKRTLTIKTDLPIFGPTTVEVEQEPTDPLTYQLGCRLSLNRRFDVMVEVGSNFDDARMLVLSGNVRF